MGGHLEVRPGLGLAQVGCRRAPPEAVALGDLVPAHPVLELAVEVVVGGKAHGLTGFDECGGHWVSGPPFAHP